MQQVEIPWPDVATLLWDGDEVCDITSGQRGNLAGSVTSRVMNMTYRFDRAVGVGSAVFSQGGDGRAPRAGLAGDSHPG